MAKRIQDDIIYQMIVNGGGGGGGITPTGTKEIAQNGLHDVAQYANAQVAVPNELLPADWVTGAYKEFNENYNLSSIQKMKIGVNIHLTRSDIVAGVEANDKIMMHGNVANNGTDVGDYVFWGTVNSITTVDNVERANITVNGIAIHMTTNFSTNVSQNGNYSTTGITNVNVNVPNSYDAGDEGKVVSGGALVAQSSQNIGANGTYDTTLKNEVVVNVAGGTELFYPPASDGYTEVANSGNITRANFRSYYVGKTNASIKCNLGHGLSANDKALFTGTLTDGSQYAVWGTVKSVTNYSAYSRVSLKAVDGSSIKPATADTYSIGSNGTIDVMGASQVDVQITTPDLVTLQVSSDGQYDIYSDPRNYDTQRYPNGIAYDFVEVNTGGGGGGSSAWSDLFDDITVDGSVSITNNEVPQGFILRQGAFKENPKLGSFASDYVTELPRQCFAGATHLSSIDTPGVAFVGYGFLGSTNCLQSVRLGQIIQMADHAFWGSAGTPGTQLIADFTMLNSVPNNAFQGCQFIREFNAPMVSSLGNQAFQAATNLVYANIPNATALSDYCFMDCRNLQWIHIGGQSGNLVTRGTNCLQSCSNLQAIYVPDALVEEYQQSSSWASLASKFIGESNMPPIV